MKILLLALPVLLTACTPRESPPTPEPVDRKAAPRIESFDACAAAGHPVMESYPRQCKTPDGRNFTEDVGNRIDKQGQIQLDEPHPNQTVQSPLTLLGKSRGSWFFEATFPVTVVDGAGATLGQGYAQADGDWMTEEFVPFRAVVTFKAPPGSRGRLLLHKANASGLPEHDDRLIVPVQFQ